MFLDVNASDIFNKLDSVTAPDSRAGPAESA